eukprot:TRINITY_DN27678_c0_g1_i2.p1 TRINITY_DN27678_c0_g1~~TRINITY_DN27678_c0_g1_i2.p1  ORF type:complete len:189 (-),score=17.60 TRINITY_DN27678_c0_g1_i2:185-751(-)
MDYKTSYKNSECMRRFVTKYAETWGVFFFVIEFGVVLASICLLIGTINETAVLIIDVASSQNPVKAASRVAFTSMALVVAVWMVLQIWSAGASVTEACSNSRDEAVQTILATVVCSRQGSKTAAAVADYERAKLMARTVENVSGFSYGGIQVSVRLGMQLTYMTLTLLFAVVAPLVKHRLHLDLTALT